MMNRMKQTALLVAIVALLAQIVLGWPTKADAARPYSDITVVMYMTDWCPYCVKARAYIKSLGVKLVEYNVERDKDKAAESMRKAGRRGVPVIDVEGIIIPGYSPEHIKAAVEKRREQ
ncbi:MAG TPA: glutaredoxin domain-containing protein [Dissulfurispiraceae bacterium]|nr:glutaredoxin domain-containing protein [Dissulfurispiraceae bacterium]